MRICLVNTISTLILMVSITCHAQQEGITLRIDPEAAIGATTSKLFTAIDYIPLETNKESLFGKIDQLYVTDEYYIILDMDTNAVLFFLKDGKFHSKINCGRKTDEVKAHFFTVDNTNRMIKIGYNFNKVKVFSFDGNLMRNYEDTTGAYYFYQLSGNTLLSYNINYSYKKNRQDSVDYELKFYSDGNLSGKAFQYANYNRMICNEDLTSVAGGFFFDTGNPDNVTLIRYYGYDIYAVSKDSIRRKYTFVFPQQRSLPRDFKYAPDYYGKRFAYIKNTSGVIFTVSHFFQLGGLLFFKLNTLNGSASYIYDLHSAALIAVDHIASDADNGYLPVTMNGNYSTANFITYSFLTTDGVNIYASVSSREMFDARDAASNRGVRYNDRIQAYFSNSSARSNPVIIKLKPNPGYPLK
ncbi:6-bladed beta-propeller [Chitinophaga sp. 212800008-4]|uniref:6-bladed beta-propeller n=2 Tax=unclassified Chitinophaga TaxID=2619133 RepID=UPI002DF0365A|nr:6-bladed beta-propeller [Chitinophaga sp. 212800010-3]